MQTTSKQMRRLSASSVVIVAATVIALGALDMGLERARFLSPTFLLVYFGQYLMCRALGVSRADIVRQDRRPHIMIARRIVARILRLEGWTYVKIGRAIGRQWSTVRDMLRPRVRACGVGR